MTPRELLERDVGEFDAEVTVHVGPGAPSVSRGHMTGRLVGGGRWLVLDFINPDTGFGGHGVYGWDEAAGHWVGTWVDSMTGTLRIMHGHHDAQVGGIVYEVDIEGPRPMRNRQLTTAPSADVRHFSSEVRPPGGEWVKVMSAVYTRASPSGA